MKSGENVCLLFNKQKICAYLVSIVTVVLLLCVAGNLNAEQNTIQTSSNSNQKLLPIYNVDTKENKVSLTMNCAW